MARKKAIKSDLEEELQEIRSEKNNILNFKINFKCRTKHQKEFLKSIYEKEITLVYGAAGTGKSYVSLYAALDLLKHSSENGYEKIVLIYPVATNPDENIGFLKGTLDEKLSVYKEADFYTMEKIINASGKNGKEIIQKLVESGKIEVKSATFLRGSTIDNSIVVISEAQNFSKDTFLKILTRIGTNSKYIFNSDHQQLDNGSIKSKKNISGLQYAKEKLFDLEEIGIIEFRLEDIVRNDIIVKVLKRWIPEVYGDIDEEKLNKKISDEKLE